MDRLLVAWQEAVFSLYLSEGKIEPEVVEPKVIENGRSWEHSGFSVDQSVLLAAGDRSGIERLVQLSTFRPKDIIPFDILVSIPTSHAACEKGGRSGRTI